MTCTYSSNVKKNVQHKKKRNKINAMEMRALRSIHIINNFERQSEDRSGLNEEGSVED